MQAKLTYPFYDLWGSDFTTYIPALLSFIRAPENLKFAVVKRVEAFDGAGFFIGPSLLLDESYTPTQLQHFYRWSKITPSVECAQFVERLRLAFTPVARALRNRLEQEFPGQRYVISQFQTNTVPAGGEIKKHIDLHREATTAQRVHLVLETNEDSFIYGGGHNRHYPVGSVFVFNNIVEHGVVNRGTTERTHLVIDFIPK